MAFGNISWSEKIREAIATIACPFTFDDVAKATGAPITSVNNIVHQLRITGVVKVVGEKSSGRRGRGIRLYDRTEKYDGYKPLEPHSSSLYDDVVDAAQKLSSRMAFTAEDVCAMASRKAGETLVRMMLRRLEDEGVVARYVRLDSLAPGKPLMRWTSNPAEKEHQLMLARIIAEAEAQDR